MFTEKKNSPGQQGTRRSLTAESDLLVGGKKAYKVRLMTKALSFTDNSLIHWPFRGWYKVALSGQGSAAVKRK